MLIHTKALEQIKTRKCEIQHQSEGQDKMQVECMLFTACLLSCNRCSGSLLVGERVPI